MTATKHNKPYLVTEKICSNKIVSFYQNKTTTGGRRRNKNVCRANYLTYALNELAKIEDGENGTVIIEEKLPYVDYKAGYVDFTGDESIIRFSIISFVNNDENIKDYENLKKTDSIDFTDEESIIKLMIDGS